VRDEREVTRLPAVAEDHGGRAVQCGGDKQGDDGAVVRLEALAGSEDVEVAQHDRFEPVGPPECLAIRLPREFGRGVRREGARGAWRRPVERAAGTGTSAPSRTGR